jgi:hypothetical protein
VITGGASRVQKIGGMAEDLKRLGRSTPPILEFAATRKRLHPCKRGWLHAEISGEPTSTLGRRPRL